MPDPDGLLLQWQRVTDGAVAQGKRDDHGKRRAGVIEATDAGAGMRCDSLKEEQA